MRKYKPVLSKGIQESYSAQVWLTVWLDGWGWNPVSLYVCSLSWYKIFFSWYSSFCSPQKLPFSISKYNTDVETHSSKFLRSLKLFHGSTNYIYRVLKNIFTQIYFPLTLQAKYQHYFVWPSGTNFVGEITSKRNLLSIASSVGLTLQSLRSSASTVWSSYKTISSHHHHHHYGIKPFRQNPSGN